MAKPKTSTKKQPTKDSEEFNYLNNYKQVNIPLSVLKTVLIVFIAGVFLLMCLYLALANNANFVFIQ